MRCVLSILIVVLGILPSASYAKTGWHLKHYPQTGDMLTSYWAAQMENIPVVTKSESPETKTHVTMMFVCSSSMKNAPRVEINLAFDERPKFAVIRKPAGDVVYYPVVFGFHKKGREGASTLDSKLFRYSLPAAVRTEHSYGFGPDNDRGSWYLVSSIMKAHELSIHILSNWDGGDHPLLIKVPMEGAGETAREAMGRCGKTP